MYCIKKGGLCQDLPSSMHATCSLEKQETQGVIPTSAVTVHP